MAVLKASQMGRAMGRMKDVVYRDAPSDACVLSQQEAWNLYDAKARQLLGIPADEFERVWKRGDLRDRQEEPAVRRLLMIRTKKPSN